MKKVVVVDKSVAKEVFKMLGLKNLKCKSCGERVTIKNYGFIGKDYVSCNSLMCLTEMLEFFEEKGIKLIFKKKRR